MFQLVYYFFYFLNLKKYKHGLGEYILEQSLSVTLLFFFFSSTSFPRKYTALQNQRKQLYD